MRVNRTLLYSGIFLVAIGGVVVAADLGGVRTEVLVDALRLWPLAIIAIGLGLVLRRTRVSLAGGMLAAAAPGLLLGGAFSVVPRVGEFCGLGDVAATAITREGTFDGPASVSVTTGCGSLDLRTDRGPGWRLEARHTDGRAPLVVGSARTLSIDAVDHDGWPGAGRDEWALTLPANGVEGLTVVVNAGRGDIDLGEGELEGLSVTANAADVSVDASAASIADLTGEVNFGRLSIRLPVGDLQGSLSADAGQLQVCAPPELGLRVTTTESMGEISVGGRHLGRSDYQSPNYASAAHRADLIVDVSFGAIEIDPIGGCR
ncbi:MAG TPA: hypothetical protein VFV53_01910 [Candidatus Limnocylindrales bacterium]|nr:hypothetical protein [Candidatus Limnocylindrales bacterium]